ncbi:MAG: 50S ribosomal protein L11 methyltransferase [Spongiibacteraceae bacterium]
MAWLQLTFPSDRESASPLEDALIDCGAVSVTLQDNADEPVLEPGVGETPLWSETKVVALFTEDAEIEIVLATLAAQFPKLPPWTLERIEEQAWERAWMDDFQPMRFGQRLWVCPSWCEPPDPNGVVLALDPGLAFGTGTHPTTALCLEWLDGIDLTDKTVIDYGCGSGILAIAALLLGAEKAIAIDNDPQALIATHDNALRNHIDPERLLTYTPEQLMSASQQQPANFIADVTVANILAGPLQSLAPTLAQHTRAQGLIALSGILEEQAGAVMESYRTHFAMQPAITSDGWVRLSGIKQSSL